MSVLDLLGRYRPTMTESGSEYNGPYSTYPEVHATTWAIGYAMLFWIAFFVAPEVAFLVLLQILRVTYYAYTGKRLDIGGHRIGLPDSYLAQIRKEPHYFVGPLTIGLVGPGAYMEIVLGMDVIGALRDVIPGTI